MRYVSWLSFKVLFLVTLTFLITILKLMTWFRQGVGGGGAKFFSGGSSPAWHRTDYGSDSTSDAIV